MPELLRDPMWQFIGVVLALAAICVSVVLYLLQRRRKALVYEFLSRTPLLSMKEEVEGKLQILFDGEPVSDVHLVVVKIVNSGNVPITAHDYERPLALSVGAKAKILTAEVSETVPESLQALATIGPDRTDVVLTPVLLNGGDSATIKMLVSQFSGGIRVDGRIVGVKDIKRLRESPLIFLLALAGIAMTMVGFFLLLSGTLSEPWAPFFLIAGGYVLMIIGMLGSRQSRRMFRMMMMMRRMRMSDTIREL
jgi:hypothetical protein